MIKNDLHRYIDRQDTGCELRWYREEGNKGKEIAALSQYIDTRYRLIIGIATVKNG